MLPLKEKSGTTPSELDPKLGVHLHQHTPVLDADTLGLVFVNDNELR